ncbi:hypothetical protein [Streptomyces sp. 891-h]|uniref:hypothetical protein n=1 Tax=Streptomyces sp. 891-h TaxID=2720714 RepID=UPI001FAB1A87|nr:hypothetical protein [Streptomyces sp. 891-h]UNZ22306.1 hypothetical protein HC362_34630 [Streptomyces sp. 891-h]
MPDEQKLRDAASAYAELEQAIACGMHAPSTEEATALVEPAAHKANAAMKEAGLLGASAQQMQDLVRGFGPGTQN